MDNKADKVKKKKKDLYIRWNQWSYDLVFLFSWTATLEFWMYPMHVPKIILNVTYGNLQIGSALFVIPERW